MIPTTFKTLAEIESMLQSQTMTENVHHMIVFSAIDPVSDILLMLEDLTGVRYDVHLKAIIDATGKPSRLTGWRFTTAENYRDNLDHITYTPEPVRDAMFCELFSNSFSREFAKFLNKPTEYAESKRYSSGRRYRYESLGRNVEGGRYQNLLFDILRRQGHEITPIVERAVNALIAARRSSY